MVAGTQAGPAADLVGWPSVTLTETQLADLELLLSGAFAPLRGYLGKRPTRPRSRRGPSWPTARRGPSR